VTGAECRRKLFYSERCSGEAFSKPLVQRTECRRARHGEFSTRRIFDETPALPSPVYLYSRRASIALLLRGWLTQWIAAEHHVSRERKCGGERTGQGNAEVVLNTVPKRFEEGAD